MREITIEVLYPEFNNLYGDSGNIEYLLKKLEKSKCKVNVINTNLYSEPAFASGKKVDILYIGPCTEKSQLLEIEQLKKYEDALSKRVNSDDLTLATGNAFELFGKYIVSATDENVKYEALGFFDYYSKRFNKLRYNELSLGSFGETVVTGFKNQLSHSYPITENKYPFLTMDVGTGMNPDTKLEGVHIYNFYATYLIGPILPLNPEFTDSLLQKLLGNDFKKNTLPFEDFAYAVRVADLMKVPNNKSKKKK